MATIKYISIFVFIVFALERLYVFPFSVPLDMQPSGKRSATYLAKTIGRKAQCTNGVSVVEVVEHDDTYQYICDMGLASFSINIYLDKSKKDAELRFYKSTSARCFKEGAYYLICELGSVKRRKFSNNQFIYSGKMFYEDFPGDDIRPYWK